MKFAAAVAGAAGLGSVGARGVAAASPRVADAAAPERQALVNATVLTMNERGSTADAVLVEGDRIAAVGSGEEVRAALRARGGGPETDLGGRTLTPGFLDPHGHFLLTGISTLTADLSAPPLGGVDSIDEVLARLRAQAAKPVFGGSLPWVVGMKFDDTAVGEQRFPTLAELDAAVPDRPLFVLHISAHLAIVNSAGLARLGITRDSADPAGGAYGRFADGVPNGLLYESAASSTLNKALPTFDPGAVLQVVDAATDRCLSAGVTTALDAAVSPLLLTAYSVLAQIPYTRVRLGLWVDGENIAGIRDAVRKAPNRAPWLQTLAVKGFADGSIQGWTAALTEPYFSFPVAGAPDGPAGKLRASVEDLTELIVTAFECGLSAAIHANGDAAADAVMAATRAARTRTGSTLPVLMQHCQVLREDQIRELAGLGISASVFSRHIYVWGDRHRDIFLGPERAARLDPARSLLDHGVSVTLHNDSPVTPLDPLATMRDAVQRRTASGAVLGAAERISAEEALAAYTSEAARQHNLSDRGVIAPGRLADFTVLDRHPRGSDLSGIRCEQTWVGGVRRWQSG
ncbi:amidohydrolase [Nocardia huaxiensis]|uniref:amidohydrolase n=1 Tax=Nocardia huaxiensis TaxID=2755382 RepID=UPI001E528F06|nr:amidohydrolase [Nocardia huaxiensis]UFS98371.1 amidohydrolase [Nocardia huaxiensis]